MTRPSTRALACRLHVLKSEETWLLGVALNYPRASSPTRKFPAPSVHLAPHPAPGIRKIHGPQPSAPDPALQRSLPLQDSPPAPSFGDGCSAISSFHGRNSGGINASTCVDRNSASTTCLWQEPAEVSRDLWLNLKLA